MRGRDKLARVSRPVCQRPRDLKETVPLRWASSNQDEGLVLCAALPAFEGVQLVHLAYQFSARRSGGRCSSVRRILEVWLNTTLVPNGPNDTDADANARGR